MPRVPRPRLHPMFFFPGRPVSILKDPLVLGNGSARAFEAEDSGSVVSVCGRCRHRDG